MLGTLSGFSVCTLCGSVVTSDLETLHEDWHMAVEKSL